MYGFAKVQFVWMIMRTAVGICKPLNNTPLSASVLIGCIGVDGADGPESDWVVMRQKPLANEPASRHFSERHVTGGMSHY
jgi:hypothetical protein